MIHRQQLIDIYLQACEIELQTFKPGNVSVYSEGHDMTVADFRLSAQVSAEPLTDPDYSLGEKIFYAIQATRNAVGCNTNLGIILLCAPLMQAAQSKTPSHDLRDALFDVLHSTTQEDANQVFQAIVLASPGGLGESADQDVHQQAEVRLLDAMALAKDRDRIAFQYVSCFKDIFDFAILEYNRAFVLSGDCEWAALTVFTQLLSHFPDSHIERKYGKQYSAWIAEHMILLGKALHTAKTLQDALPMLHSIDNAFKAKNINPGTTADMTVATITAVLLEQLFSQPH